MYNRVSLAPAWQIFLERVVLAGASGKFSILSGAIVYWGGDLVPRYYSAHVIKIALVGVI